MCHRLWDGCRKWSIWQRSQVMLEGSISQLFWKGLEIASRAAVGLYLIFTLKQQYKNNRLLTGGCRHLSFSPHVACAPGVPRSFRLARYRSAASCTLCTPIVLGTAQHCCYTHGKQWQKQRGGGWRRPRGGKVSCWCQTKKKQIKKSKKTKKNK